MQRGDKPDERLEDTEWERHLPKGDSTSEPSRKGRLPELGENVGAPNRTEEVLTASASVLHSRHIKQQE